MYHYRPWYLRALILFFKSIFVVVMTLALLALLLNAGIAFAHLYALSPLSVYLLLGGVVGLLSGFVVVWLEGI